ncbi:MAG: phenylalanine--tRNA ligase beta subunit-related protein [Myxococcaceae bacterium]
MKLAADPHPLLDARAFTTTFDRRMADVPAGDAFMKFLRPDAVAPLQSSDEVRSAVRDLLRHGGYKPTGRGKPASEYLIRAVAESALSSINAGVDACNAVSFHSGLPISVVDLDRAKEPFRIGVAREGSQYVFNASGQTIDVAGLLCLFDAEGPCANAVKDSQRTKTTPDTTRTLTVIWGSTALPGRAAQAEKWYRELLESVGAKTEDVAVG